MKKYTESDGITTKTEFDESSMIGWSVLDATPVYAATVTVFSIADGVIEQGYTIVDSDGNAYKPTAYRNLSNGFTRIA